MPTGSTITIIVLVLLLLKSWRKKQPDKFADENHTWVYNQSGVVPPMRVPLDLEQEALVMFRDEDAESLNAKLNPWTYEVSLQNIRTAMIIAREEPDIEIAMMMWLGNTVTLGDT